VGQVVPQVQEEAHDVVGPTAVARSQPERRHQGLR
jgi:hypothetical protein